MKQEEEKNSIPLDYLFPKKDEIQK